jgi:hypothetical protein
MIIRLAQVYHVTTDRYRNFSRTILATSGERYGFFGNPGIAVGFNFTSFEATHALGEIQTIGGLTKNL